MTKKSNLYTGNRSSDEEGQNWDEGVGIVVEVDVAGLDGDKNGSIWVFWAERSRSVVLRLWIQRNFTKSRVTKA